MSGFVVVDASLAFKWLVREEHTDKALAILRVWQNEDVILAAPHLLPFEVSNALHKRVTRGELSVEGSTDLIGNLLASQIELHQPWNLHGKALVPRQADSGRLPHTTPTTWRLPPVSIANYGLADEKYYRSVRREMVHVRWIGKFDKS